MDPQATLFDLLVAIQDNDRDQVSELLEALATWIDKGGFLPEVETLTDTHAKTGIGSILTVQRKRSPRSIF